MKRTLTILSFVTIAGLSTAFAASAPRVNPRVLSEFKKEFPFAKDSRWEKDNGYSKVVFLYEDVRTIAYYTDDGEFAGSARDLFYEQLPLNVLHQVNGRFGTIVPLESIEITNTDDTHYQIVFESGNKRYTIEATPSGDISVVRKQKIHA